jgi:hypothetical protein
MRAEEGLREIDRMPAPDLWPDIRTRMPRGEPPGPRWTRLATIALALAVAAAGLGLVAVAFLGGPEARPVAPASPTPTPTRPAIPTPSPDPENPFPAHSDPWGAPTTLSVTCTDGGIEPLSTEVPAQPDGVHIVVANPGGANALSIHARGPRPVPYWDKTDRIVLRPGGLTRETVLLSPGPVEIGCSRPGVQEPKETVQVTDPDRLWVSDELSCEDTIPYKRTESAPYTHLEMAVRENVHGVLPSDDIVRAGYPEDVSPVASMVVVRDGEPVATIVLIFSEEGWIPLPGEICVSSGIMGA